MDNAGTTHDPEVEAILEALERGIEALKLDTLRKLEELDARRAQRGE
jgi:hypothetical protein